jgi:hypothetical protein
MYYVNQELTVEDFLYDDNYKINLTGSNPDVLDNLEAIDHLEYPQFNLPQELPPNMYFDMSNCGQSSGDAFLHMSDLLTTMTPTPAAFLRPKCALWDCPRPVIGSERWQDYCSIYHADLAVKEEGPPGTMPVIRPRGIDLKDGPLFAALSAKIQGKHVGIPICEGAAISKSPWNAPGKLFLHNICLYMVLNNFVYFLTWIKCFFHCYAFCLQNFSLFTFLKVNLSENGYSLTNQEGHLIVEIGSNGPCQITVAVVGMNQGSR